MTKFVADNFHSEVEFSVKHMMVTKVKGTFEEYSIEIEADSIEDFENASLKATAKPGTINTGVGDRDGSALAAGLFGEAGLAGIRYPDLDRAQAGRAQGGTVPLHPVVHVVGCYHDESSIRFM